MLNNQFPVWKVNDKEYTLDLQDLNDVEKYINACDVLSEQEKKFDNSLARTERIKAYCKMYFDFFDALFGANTSKDIFKGKVNARTCDEVFADFIKYIESTNAYSAKISKETEELLSKYISK